MKLLKNIKYKNKIGMDAKSSLVKMNDDTLNTWDNLFISLNNGEKDFQNLRNGVEFKYNKKEIQPIQQKKQEVKTTNLPIQKSLKNLDKEKKVTLSDVKDKKDISRLYVKEKKDINKAVIKEKKKVNKKSKKNQKNNVTLKKHLKEKSNK